MSHLNGRGNLVFAQIERPKVRFADNDIQQVWPHRAISVYWVDDDTLIGNWQREAGIDRWFVGRLNLITGEMREWNAFDGAWPVFDGTEIVNVGSSVVRGGGGAWAFDYGSAVVSSAGKFDGFAVCTVGDQGDVWMTSRPDSDGLYTLNDSGTLAVRVADGPVIRAAHDTRSRGVAVSWDGGMLRYWPPPSGYVQRVERCVGIPIPLHGAIERSDTRLTYRPDLTSALGLVVEDQDECWDADAVKLADGTVRVAFFTQQGQLEQFLRVVDINLAHAHMWTDLNAPIVVDPDEEDSDVTKAELEAALAASEGRIVARIMSESGQTAMGLADLRARLDTVERLQRAERKVTGLRYVGEGTLKAQP